MQDNATTFVPASLPVRVAAMIYESLLVIAVFFVASFIVLPVVGDLHRGWQRHLFQAYLVVVLFAYFATFWLRSGQTLAMKTWRIRLDDRSGGRVSFRQAVLRFALALAGALLVGAGYWWALFDRERQFFHDRVAGTRLVRVPPKT
ncbi:putative transmembrane protein [Thiobacillus denitrificans ATCC 25259]|uniref:Putative transmembrane protein n=1 Tax=Thiobacillus denitrificans (strain ATCC 25259 / T1) TaxID=292415 RepID=Q3SHD8_THIDA|nr:RDD family protein [Thiobacillus denitrificans]AAZ97948.1 putative transmembrane protein [Thiobacillus denitrificans ATCC 25259]